MKNTILQRIIKLFNFKFANKFKITACNNSTLASNMFYLSLVQFLNYLLPLLTVPLLARVLGPEIFGLLAFSNAITLFFIIVIDYGFSLTGVRQVSLQQKDQNKLQKIFSSIMQAKLIIISLCSLILFMMCISITKIEKYWLLHVISFSSVIGHFLLPVWFFHGLERMREVALITLAHRLISALLIILLVRSDTDYLLVPAFVSITHALAGVYAMIILHKKHSIKFSFTDTKSVLLQLQDGWAIFLASLSTNIYTSSIAIFIGFLSATEQVGFFTAAEKIIRVVKGVYSAVTQALYPYLAKKFNSNIETALEYSLSIRLFLFAPIALTSAMIFGFSDLLINLLFGEAYKTAVVLLRIMSLVPLLVAISNLYGIQIMTNTGQKQKLTKILVLGAALGVVSNFLLIPAFGSMGAVTTVVGVEFIVACLVVWSVRRYAKSRKDLGV